MAENNDFTDIFAGRTIIVADDILINRKIIGILLKETGISIDYAEDGYAVLNLFISNPEKYDLILTDINMPEMDGYETVKLIRESSHGKDIPIITMTANHLTKDIDKCLAAGMNDHVSKPVEIDELVAKLKKYLH